VWIVRLVDLTREPPCGYMPANNHTTEQQVSEEIGSWTYAA
jgi:hypothetical protein